MPDSPKIEIVKVPMLDTGIGREAGFKDDAELIAVAQAERDALSPQARKRLEEIEKRIENRALYGR